ncbi:hypothetical protein [Chryseolinea sp. H1M3-3]|uniref:hypothetical protein n=1 Tax=Chryseolinea sp. H1M3-3 TaxID=3034144 RepID=UPI0023ED26BA|nr:hypothetical protein [Chryseolinea sp. H1M3-3]
MNYKTIVFVLLAALVSPVFGQTKGDVFNPDTQITWLGLDFSGAKFIGDRERLGSESDIRHLLDAINELMIKEADKYNVAAALKRKTVENAIDITNEHNAELDILSMISAEGKDHIHLKPDDVDQIISTYDFKGKSGIGLMFNVESFNKVIEEGSFWITFINMGTKEVLFTERLTAPPSGFGMRNFWAGSVNGVLAKIKKKEFENWRKKHG